MNTVKARYTLKFYLMDYIRNSKNRKLKMQIITFLSRLNFGANRLWIAGKWIMFCNILLFASLFIPWMQFRFLDSTTYIINAFSWFSGFIGYFILLTIGVIGFFLLSHEKKERIRAYVPFRLSDAQAIVFLDAILLTLLFHTIIISLQTYSQFAVQGIEIGFWFKLALWAALLLLFWAYFFSKNEKESMSTLNYLDKKEYRNYDEYQDILNPKNTSHDPNEKNKNITLPI